MINKSKLNTLTGLLRSIKAGGPGRGCLVRSGEVLELMGLSVSILTEELRGKKPEVVAEEIVESGFLDYEGEPDDNNPDLEFLSTSGDETGGTRGMVGEGGSGPEEFPISVLGLDEDLEGIVRKAGHETVQSVFLLRGNLTQIKGVGPSRAEALEQALSKYLGESAE